MNFKKLLSLLLACMMCLSAGISSASDKDAEAAAASDAAMKIPDTLYYTGGVVFRSFARGTDAAATSSLIDLAYVMTSAPYIILDETTTWEVTISGGVEPYTCMALLAHQDDLSMDPFTDPWSTADYFEVTSNAFDYTFTDAGRYFWEFRIEDAAGQSLNFQTRIYETYAESDETDAETVVGKVNSIIASEITDSMSDYSRALALHDWLIYNANYDYTYTHYDAAGVLLYGTGVCDSYARAYLMLMTAAGVDCMIVTGTAGSASADSSTWGNHAWNLVKLDGSWYHVDCTWDDPNQGGNECHTYFCVDDETMAADHRWNRADDMFDSTGIVAPDADGGDLEADGEAAQDYDFVFATIDEYDLAFDTISATEQRATTIGYYTGSDEDIWSAFCDWVNEQYAELYGAGLVTGGGMSSQGDLYKLSLTWAEPDEYLRIDETEFIISVDEDRQITPSEYVSESHAFTCVSTDPAVATACASYSAASGMIVTVTGISEGTATITVSSVDGLSDSFNVTVLPPYMPSFDLALTELSTGVKLTWNSIPGVTEYHVMRYCQNAYKLLAIVTDTEVTLTSAQLPDSVVQEIYVDGMRIVGDEVVVTYQSNILSYGQVSITYTSVLPASTVTIEDNAFLNNQSLTTVDIPSGVKTIGANAFAGCTALTAVRIPASVTSIAASAFSGCELVYAEVVKGSDAEAYFSQYYPDVTLIYE